jgi:hypothetical protein
VVVVASPPSGRGQTLPLQTERRTVGMIYNCSIRFETAKQPVSCAAASRQQPKCGVQVDRVGLRRI